MYVYFAPYRLFAVFLEVDRKLGLTPSMSYTTCEGEIMIDLPYTQIIVTTGRKLTMAQNRDHDPRDPRSPENLMRAAKDRP